MLTFTPKPADATYRYVWQPPLSVGDSISSAVLTVDSGTATIASYENDGASVIMFLAGGTAGAVTVITGVVTTSDGETLTETIYLAVTESTNRLGNTARAVCQYALRKINGNGNNADADQLEDAMERLNDMLAAWKAQGADVGVALPLVSTDVLYVADEFIQPIKANLHLELIEHYGQQPGQRVVMTAARGLQLVKAALLPDDRGQADYY